MLSPETNIIPGRWQTSAWTMCVLSIKRWWDLIIRFKDQYINLAVLWSKSVVSVKEILRWKEKENIYFFISHHLIENYFFLAMIYRSGFFFTLIFTQMRYCNIFSPSYLNWYKNNNRFLSVEYYIFIVRLQNRILRVLLVLNKYLL